MGKREKKKREKQRAQFVDLAWENINSANELIARQLRRAVRQEELIDELIAYFKAIPAGEIGEKQRQALIEKVENLKLEDLKKLTSTLSTLCDKQQQAREEEGETPVVRVVMDGNADSYAG